MKGRILLTLISTGVMVYGLLGLLGLGQETVIRALIWGVGGLVLHDFFLVPLVLGAGALLRRAPHPVRIGVQVPFIVVGTALLTLTPIWLENPNTPEPGFLPLEYGRNVLVMLAAAAALGVVTGTIAAVRQRRAKS